VTRCFSVCKVSLQNAVVDADTCTVRLHMYTVMTRAKYKRCKRNYGSLNTP
jgi:hypothetical protein